MTGPRPAFDHVVFDLDGTLVDSRADLAGSVNHVLRTLGLAPLDPPTVYSYVGEGARRLVQRALGDRAPARVDEALRLFLAHYGDHLLDTTVAYPGIPQAVAALRRAGVTLSVLSNKPAPMSRTIVDGLGLGDAFVTVLGGDSLPTRKPDPAGLAHLQALTRTPPLRMLLVGDSMIDLRTARAGGVPFCGVTWGFGPDALRAAAPELMIARPHELLRVVLGAHQGAGTGGGSAS